jgi:hypothetical protein
MRKLIGIIAIFISLIVSQNCFADPFDQAKGGFTEKSDCPILFELSWWNHNELWNSWSRNQHWFGPDSWITGTSIGLSFDQEEKSYSITKNLKNPAALVYIGPWKKVTLTYPANFWENPKKTEVEIRLIASQNGPNIERHFETKDDLNKNIPEQRLVLLRPVNDLIRLCDIRWVAAFGYNAVTDYKLNPFRALTGKTLTGSGKIIDSETGKLIADKDGKLVETKE